MPFDYHTIAEPDGRQLRVGVAGPPDGIPVLVHNGTPASHLLYDPWIHDAEARGIQLISYDRPGYGRSTSQPGRRVADAARDVAAIAQALGVRRLAVWGISGGGPHALACAALLPNLVGAAAALASPAPYHADGLDWFAGMGEDNLVEFGAAREGREPLWQYIEGVAPYLLNASPAKMDEAFRSLLSPVDVAVLADGVADYLFTGLCEGSRDSRAGWMEDDLALTQDWGFEVSQIQVPVLVMQGAQDKMVPFSHGQWLAQHLPRVEARLLPEDGHLTLFAHHIPEVHAWLLSQM